MKKAAKTAGKTTAQAVREVMMRWAKRQLKQQNVARP
jgi:hypothetical protein